MQQEKRKKTLGGSFFIVNSNLQGDNEHFIFIMNIVDV